jgi:antitoxin component YwqK of YwqJK toxin-antitoxin module
MRNILIISLSLLIMVGCGSMGRKGEISKEIKKRSILAPDNFKLLSMEEIYKEDCIEGYSVCYTYGSLKSYCLVIYTNGKFCDLMDLGLDNMGTSMAKMTINEWRKNPNDPDMLYFKNCFLCEKNGVYTEYYENGQKRWERTYKDGKKDGLSTRWYENGQKLEEGTYKDGKENGLRTLWYENGQKEGEVDFKDGLMTQWYKNGQKRLHGFCIGASQNGLMTFWYKNGQKKEESIIKDGELIELIGRWNEDGSVRREPFSWSEKFITPKE